MTTIVIMINLVSTETMITQFYLNFKGASTACSTIIILSQLSCFHNLWKPKCDRSPSLNPELLIWLCKYTWSKYTCWKYESFVQGLILQNKWIEFQSINFWTFKLLMLEQHHLQAEWHLNIFCKRWRCLVNVGRWNNRTNLILTQKFPKNNLKK